MASIDEHEVERIVRKKGQRLFGGLDLEAQAIRCDPMLSAELHDVVDRALVG